MLEVRDLRIRFRDDSGGGFEAVRGVTFDLDPGETLAIVGESGSGKSVTGMTLARLLPEPPAEIAGGEIRFDGQSVAAMDRAALRRLRGSQIGYVFQEPGTSLNPVFTVRTQIGEAIRLHRPEVEDVDAEVVRWLDRVGITAPESRLRAYPHELSGGMQQRVVIAMALACRPKLLVADEPTTALDATVERKVIALLGELQDELGTAIILITHNFGIIRGVADKVAVMYRGEFAETGTVEEVLDNPQHPYTKALIACVPKIGQNRRRLATIDSSE
ncbi:ABC transporter ATP-binding protein [soil metagenome]